MEIKWKVPDDTYLDYLRDNYDKRIPFSDYGDDKYKPFFGSLFETGELVYISQISHPQDRHNTIKQAIDFYKIYHPDDNRLIAVVNINYMFPIHKSLLIDLQYKNIDQYRTFDSIESKSKYIDLLTNEIKQINQLPIIENAKKIYAMKYDYPDSKVAKRSLDFKRLEQGCRFYMSREKQEIQEIIQTEKIIASISEESIRIK